MNFYYGRHRVVFRVALPRQVGHQNCFLTVFLVSAQELVPMAAGAPQFMIGTEHRPEKSFGSSRSLAYKYLILIVLLCVRSSNSATAVCAALTVFQVRRSWCLWHSWKHRNLVIGTEHWLAGHGLPAAVPQPDSVPAQPSRGALCKKQMFTLMFCPVETRKSYCDTVDVQYFARV
jgi:hypothetical protein